MSKRSLVLAMLLVPSAALAADQTPADPIDGSEKTICEAIATDQLKCAQAFAICHWDPLDGRCEINTSQVAGCASIFSPAACTAQPTCVWDQSDPLGPRCESLGG